MIASLFYRLRSVCLIAHQHGQDYTASMARALT